MMGKLEGRNAPGSMLQLAGTMVIFALCFCDWPEPVPDHVACINAARQTRAPSVRMSKITNVTGVAFYI